MSLRVYVDTGDIYHKMQRYYDTKLDYGLYLDRIEELFGEIDKATAYGSQSKGEATGFITCLQSIGFETKYKRPHIFKIGDREIKRCEWGIEISIDVLRTIKAGDTIILGISNTDYIPLISYLRSFGVRVVIFAVRVPKVLSKIADKVIEISDTLFEEEEDEIDHIA